MQIGARMFKTILALTLSLWIAEMAGFSSPIFAAISCFLTLKPTVLQSWRNVWMQIVGNTIGAGCAALFGMFIGTSPIYAGLAVLLLLLLHKPLQQSDSLSLSVVTLLSILEFQHGHFITFAIERFSTTMVGVLVACLVNVSIFPPKYESRLFQHLQSYVQTARPLFLDAFSHRFVTSTRKHVTSSLQRDIHALADVFHYYKEEFSSTRSIPVHPHQKRGYKQQKRLIIFQTWIRLCEIKQRTYDTLMRHSLELSKWPQDVHLSFQSFIQELLEYEEWLLLLFLQQASSLPDAPDPSRLPHYLLKDPSLSVLFGVIWEWHIQLSLVAQYVQNENDQLS